MKETAMKVVICDDHDFYRSQLKRAISQYDEIDVMAEAANGIQLLSILSRNKPDVVLLDLRMPIMDGIATLKEIRKKYPSLIVYILSLYGMDHESPEMIALGISGILSKNDDLEKIISCIMKHDERKIRLTA